MAPGTTDHLPEDNSPVQYLGTPHRFLVRLRATMLAGLFVLMPFGVLFFLAFQVWKLMRKKMYAMTDALGVGSELRLTTALLLTAIVIALAALVAGLLVRYGVAKAKGRHYVERNLLQFLPGYGLMRLRMAEKLGQRSPRRTALLRTPLGLQPVMIMERDASRAVVFLPQAPGAKSGALLIVDPSSLEPLDMTAPQLDDRLYAVGTGLLARIPASVRP